MEGCALTVNPLSGNRGSSIKLIESMAAGRVCVSTREGARGFLDVGFPSLLVVDRIDEFGTPLERLLLDNEHRRDLEAPREDLLQDYSWKKSAQSLARIYRHQLDVQAQTEAM